jgi:hypothetical protein
MCYPLITCSAIMAFGFGWFDTTSHFSCSIRRVYANVTSSYNSHKDLSRRLTYPVATRRTRPGSCTSKPSATHPVDADIFRPSWLHRSPNALEPCSYGGYRKPSRNLVCLHTCEKRGSTDADTKWAPCWITSMITSYLKFNHRAHVV